MLGSLEKTPMVLNELLIANKQIIALSRDKGGYGGNFNNYKKDHPETAKWIETNSEHVLQGRSPRHPKRPRHPSP